MNNKTKIDKYSQYDFSSLDGHSKNVEHVAQPPAKLRSWIIRNSMLLVTVSGVVFGIIEGIYLVLCLFESFLRISDRDIRNKCSKI